jgi:hypothetical protein
MSSEVFITGSDVRTRCRSLARWLCAQGYRWQGSPAQLFAAISPPASDPVNFTDADDLATFLITDAEELRQFGVAVKLSQAAGGERTVTLRTSLAELRSCKVAPLTDHDLEAETVRTLEAQNTDTAKRRVDVRPLSILAPALESSPNAVALAETELRVSGQDRATHAKRKLAIVAIAAAVIATIALLASPLQRYLASTTRPDRVSPTAADRVSAATYVRPTPAGKEQKNESRGGVTPGAQQENTQVELSTLLQQALQQRSAASQYELGIRYAEGRGVAADKVSGYAWLILAAANGNPRSEPVLRKLTTELSPGEIQRIRIKVGIAYAEGAGVDANDVIAHSWFSLAEHAGSADGTVLKDRLESRMTREQIVAANTRTIDWLRRH